MKEVQALVNHYTRPLGKDTKGVYYVASPYTADDTTVIQDRVLDIRNCIVPQLITAYPGITPVVPVTITDPLANSGCVPEGGWYAFGLKLLNTTEGMIIVQQDGWEDSRGIMLEFGFARGKGLPIATLDPGNIVSEENSFPHVKTELGEIPLALGKAQLTESGPTESQVLEKMKQLREMGGYEDFDDTQLRVRAIEILTDEIPF